MTKPLGLYLHIPFCTGKCAYCDFYSVFPSEHLLDTYSQALIREIKQWGGNINRPIDTIYLGGGTPSLLAHRLCDVMSAVEESFCVSEDAEITLEMNPGTKAEELLVHIKNAGVNRLSIGAQSGSNEELAVLGRKHTAEDTVNAVKKARNMGFDNISLDIMLGLPDSNSDSLQKSLEYIADLNPEHISAYILKVEENTAFFKKQDILNFPNEDSVSEQYLQMCSFFEGKGYSHYEISNFSRKGLESRHNLKYWELEDYLGIGPAAHSCIEGKRFFYPRDIKSFIKGNSPLSDGESGGKEEYIMLKLRTAEGISLRKINELGITPAKKFFNRCQLLQKGGLIIIDGDRIFLTNKGMLLSNSIIIELTECLE